MKKNIGLLVVFIVVVGAAYFIYNRNSHSTIADEPLTDFAIQDTSTITRVFIVDHHGKKVKLERNKEKNTWIVNDKYQARTDAMFNLLEVFARISVRGNVPAAGRENMMKVIASAGKKVEIYQGGDEPSKIYYIGSNTPDHFGTVMLLEIPGIGRSEDPFITHMEGFTGFLNPRFFVDENEWRFTGIFNYPDLNFKKIALINYSNPTASFQIEYGGGNDIKMNGYDPVGNTFPIASFDTLAVKDYLILFKKVHIESYNTLLKPQVADSISKSVPLYEIAVTEQDGTIKVMDLYRKRAKEPRIDAEGNVYAWDSDYFWGKSPSGEMCLAQTFVFANLTPEIFLFNPKK